MSNDLDTLLNGMSERVKVRNKHLTTQPVRPSKQPAPEAPGEDTPEAAKGNSGRRQNQRQEAAFQDSVIGYLTLNGFRIAHFKPVQTIKGEWLTPVAADGAGFPDLIAVRPPKLIPPRADRAGYERPALQLALELKVEPNTPSKKQLEWLEYFAQVEGCEAAVLYPRDWEKLEALVK